MFCTLSHWGAIIRPQETRWLPKSGGLPIHAPSLFRSLEIELYAMAVGTAL